METLFEPKRYLNGNQFPKFRAIVLGNSKVGKTSLIMRYMNHHFRNEYFPTKDIVVYKNLINFNPSSEDENEYVYLEVLDTISYDRGKSLTDYVTFFNLVSRNDIQISALNAKLGKIAESIKYEYFFKKKHKNSQDPNKVETKTEISKRRLFTFNNIMAYIFVFDYNDDKSIEDMNVLCKSISENESSKNEKRPELDTVKVFIGNKYPHNLDDEMEERDTKSTKNSYPIFERDLRANEILNKLKFHYGKDENLAKQNLFFVNAKFNIGIENAFDSCFKKILQKDELWKVRDFDSESEDSETEREVKKVGLLDSVFCCKGRDKALKKKNRKGEVKDIHIEDKLDKAFYKAQTSETDEVVFRDAFKDDEDDEDYDLNFVFKPKIIEAKIDVNKEPEKEKEVEKKNEKCSVY